MQSEHHLYLPLSFPKVFSLVFYTRKHLMDVYKIKLKINKQAHIHHKGSSSLNDYLSFFLITTYYPVLSQPTLQVLVLKHVDY